MLKESPQDKPKQVQFTSPHTNGYVCLVNHKSVSLLSKWVLDPAENKI